jgi:hypothetical protein
MKVTFFSDVIGRMQTQFQVILTLETALATALIVSNTGQLTKGAKWIALLEVGLSVAWLLVGQAGRTRATTHRRDLEEAGTAWATATDLPADYRPVGSGPPIARIAVLGPAAFLVGWLVLFVIFATHD